MQALFRIRWPRLILLSLLACFFVMLLYLFDSNAERASANEPTHQRLFIDAGRVKDSSAKEATVMRGRLVYINFERLNDINHASSAGDVGSKKLQLNLFEQMEFVARLDHIESNPSGSYTWIGHLDGVADSEVMLVIKNEVMIGKITTLTSQYEVRYVGDGLHEVLQIDQAAFPDLKNDTIVVNKSSIKDEPSRQPASRSDDGSVIDVLVLYTADALAEGGGSTDAIENVIDLAVAESNQAYQNSQVNQRIFLVHTAQVDYTETEDSTIDLPRLRRPNDGFMDEAHSLRDTYHADHVMLVTQSGYCGLAYLQAQAPDADFAAYAFGIARQDCVTGNLTFAHELGHNMGLRHDWYQDDNVTPFTHAHGYVNNNSSAPWRTVMAYNSLCADQEFSCPRVSFFSNPNLTIGGAAMGVHRGTGSNCVEDSLTPNPSTCDADNHAVLNTTASTVAQFRTASTTWLGKSTEWNSSDNWSTGIVPRFMDDVIIPATPNGGQYPTINGMSHIRNMLIENGATLNMSASTLNVYGNWQEEGTGRFTATGGQVIFKSYLDQTISMNRNSHFYHLQLGDGRGKHTITALSDLDINGNLILMTNITFNADSYVISVAGNWTDQGNGFVPNTSTVVFDGHTQHVTKVTTSTILSQDFSYRNGSDGLFSLSAPSGWTTEDAGDGAAPSFTARWLFGDSTGAPNSPYSQAYARRWYDATATVIDAWLFTPQLSLNQGVTYQLQFNYGASSSSDAQDFSAYYGHAAASTEMKTQIVAISNATNNSWNTATQRFTVPSSGSYYLGLRNHDQTPSSGRAGMDDIILTARQGATFYNLQVDTAGDGLTFNSDIAVKNHLTIGSNGLLNLSSHEITVEGKVTNNGGLQQSKEVSDGSGATTYHFLTIKNAAGTQSAYYGVDLTPDGNNALDFTSVHILGHHYCTDKQADPILHRCFEISPTTPASATIKYWFSEAERNQQAANSIKIWDHNGTSWAQEGQNSRYGSTGEECTSDATCWYEWENVDNFSPMTGGSHNAPTGNPISVAIATPTASNEQYWLPILLR